MFQVKPKRNENNPQKTLYNQEQIELPISATEIILPLGQFTIMKKNQDRIKTIKAPGAQTCVVVVLTSPRCVAVAHIDSAFGAKELIFRMIDEIKQEEQDDEIQAELVGGDVGFWGGSSVIYKTIYEALQNKKIPYKHDHYSFNNIELYLPILPIFFLVKMLFDGMTDESFVAPLTKLFLLYLLQVVLAQGVVTKILPSNNFDVSVDAKNMQINLITNNLQNTVKILEKLPLEQLMFFEKQNAISPTDCSSSMELKKYVFIKPSCN